MAAMNLCWIAHSTSNVTWTRLSNLKSFPTFKVMGWHFSTTTHFLSQSASHSTSLDQMQSIQCPSQHTRRHVPHPASARDLTDHQMRSRDPRPQTVVQLYLVIQDVWDDITQARIIHLILFMPRRCRVVHEAHGLPQPSLTLLHLTACCTEESATINFNLANDDSRQIVDSTHTKQFPTVFTFIELPIDVDVQFLFSMQRNLGVKHWIYVKLIVHLFGIIPDGCEKTNRPKYLYQKLHILLLHKIKDQKHLGFN